MRSKLYLAVFASAACLGVAACGSSKHATSVSSPATTSAATVTTTSATTKTHAASTKAKTHTVSGSSAKPAANAATASASIPVAKTFNSPIPSGCLAKQGYQYHYYVERGILAASRAPVAHVDVNAHVYVDGPYKNAPAAAAAAQSLLGTEYAASGGLYEVSATLRSHANAAVQAIAACLKSRPSPGKARSKTKKKSFGF